MDNVVVASPLYLSEVQWNESLSFSGIWLMKTSRRMALTGSLQLSVTWGSSGTGNLCQGQVGAPGRGDKDCPVAHPTHGLLAWVVVVQL